MKRVLCYGDSNTWGYISGSDHLRYGEKERWTRLLGKFLGRKYEIIEEGLNSRTLVSTDIRPGREGREGIKWLKPCLDSQDKVDIVVLMLGTNELKNDYKKSAEEIADMLFSAVEIIKNYKSQIDKSTPELIVSGIPKVNDECEYCKKEEKYSGCKIKAEKLNEIVKAECMKKGIAYVDNMDLEVGADGIHITKESHNVLAKKLCRVIKGMKI